MEKEILLALYGTDQPDAIATKKQSEKQQRVYTGMGPSKVPMTPDECRKMCDKIGKEYLPGYESRVLSYMTTNEACDRYGDIVRANGAKLDAYLKNPVVMFSHQHDNFPVGASLKVWVDKKEKCVPAQALFLDDRVDTSGRADLVYKFAASGFMPACSIGFMPIRCNRPTTQEERIKLGLGDYGVEYLEWEYLEFSPCSIPANPDALQNALKSCDLKSVNFDQKDIDTLVVSKWMEMNMLDQFVETIKGKVGKVFVLPQIALKTDQDNTDIVPIVPVVAAEPPTCVSANDTQNVVIHNVTVNAPMTIDASQIVDAIKAITEPIAKLMEQLETRTSAIIQRLEVMSAKPASPGASSDETKAVDDIYKRVMEEGIKIKVKP